MKENQTAETEVVQKHPLDGYEPKLSGTFEEWLATWSSTKDQSARLGLIHNLQKNNRAMLIQKELSVSFLFSLADGCDYRDRDGTSRRDLLNELSCRALTVLCLKFFKGDKGNTPSADNRQWWWILDNEKIFEKVLWFFRKNRLGANCIDPVNVSDSDNEQVIILRFLRETSRLVFTFHPRSKAQELMLMKARPWAIDVLDWLDELPWLFGRELDELSVAKLTEIAMGNTCTLPGVEVGEGNQWRKPENLGEAVLGGYMAAYVLLIHRTCLKQRAIFKVKYDHSVQKFQAEQKRLELERTQLELVQLEAKRQQLLNQQAGQTQQ